MEFHKFIYWFLQFLVFGIDLFTFNNSKCFLNLCLAAALGVQQPSLLGASPSMYTQQSALAAASLNTQSAANYQISQQTAALQQQAVAAAAAAAALQQVCNALLVNVGLILAQL